MLTGLSQSLGANVTKPPKKIWITPPDARLIGWTSSEENVMPQDTPYIRADLVDGLVEAMEHIEEYWNRDQNEQAMADALWHIIDTAHSALAKIKEER